MYDEDKSIFDISKLETIHDFIQELVFKIANIAATCNGRVPSLKYKKVRMNNEEYTNLLTAATMKDQAREFLTNNLTHEMILPVTCDNYVTKNIRVIEHEVPPPLIKPKKKKGQIVVEESPEVIARRDNLEAFYSKELNTSVDFSKAVNIVKIESFEKLELQCDPGILEKENLFREEKARQEEARQQDHQRRLEKQNNENAQKELKKHISKHMFTFDYEGNPIILKDIKDDKLNFNNFITVKHTSKAVEDRKPPGYASKLISQS